MTDGPLLPPPPPDRNRPGGPTLPPPPPWMTRPRPGAVPGPASTPVWPAAPARGTGAPAPRPDPEPKPSSPLRNLAAAVAIILVVVLGTGGLLWTLSRVGDTGFEAPTERPTRKPSIAIRPSPTPRPSPSAAPTPAPTPTPAPLKAVVIGVTLPLTGDLADVNGSARNGIQLAVDEAVRGQLLPGISIKTRVLDYGTADGYNADDAAADMRSFVADPSVVGVVGPYHSSVARLQIPIGSRAGLIACSMSTIAPDLTKGVDAASLRARGSTHNTFLRVITPSDDEGVAMADYAWNTLGLRRVGMFTGDGFDDVRYAFQLEWEQLGGTLALDAVASTTIAAADVAALADADVDGVYFVGLTGEGGSALSKALDAAGLGKLPLLGTQGIIDGDASEKGSFLKLAGTRKGETYATITGIEDYRGRDEFESRYKAAFGAYPGYYAAGAYACTQVILASIRSALDDGAITRDAVLGAATERNRSFNTLYGGTTFNAGGDMTPGSIAIYRRYPAGDGAPIDWRLVEELPVIP